MLSLKKKRILAEIGCLLCGMVWGGSFVVVKSVSEAVTPNWVLGLRFIVPAAVLALYLGKRLKVSKNVFLVAAFSGVLQYLGFLTQVIGLTTTTAGNSAFISALYVVLVPFCLWAYTKKRPKWTVLAAGSISVLGVGLLVLQPGVSVNVGDLWTIAAAILFAVNLALIAVCVSGGMDALAFTCIQFLFTALPALAIGALFEPFPAAEALFSADILWGFFYLIVLSTIFAQVVQNVALVYADPSHASLIFGTEAVFGALCGAIFLGEAITPRFLAGAALVAAAVVLSAKTKPK